MGHEESEPTHTNEHEAGAEETKKTGHPTVPERFEADAGAGAVLAPGTSETNPFIGLHAKGEGKLQ